MRAENVHVKVLPGEDVDDLEDGLGGQVEGTEDGGERPRDLGGLGGSVPGSEEAQGAVESEEDQAQEVEPSDCSSEEGDDAELGDRLEEQVEDMAKRQLEGLVMVHGPLRPMEMVVVMGDKSETRRMRQDKEAAVALLGEGTRRGRYRGFGMRGGGRILRIFLARGRIALGSLGNSGSRQRTSAVRES